MYTSTPGHPTKLVPNTVGRANPFNFSEYCPYYMYHGSSLQVMLASQTFLANKNELIQKDSLNPRIVPAAACASRQAFTSIRLSLSVLSEPTDILIQAKEPRNELLTGLWEAEEAYQ